MDFFNRLDEVLTKILCLLICIMALSLATVVVLRYGFGFGATSLSELSAYLMVCICTLGMSQTYHQDRHVRLDILYSSFSPTQQHWINLLGNLILLMPFCLFLLLYCFEYVSRSWQLSEGSGEAAGLPGVFLIKLLLLLGPALLLVRTLFNAKHLLTQIHQDQTIRKL